MKQIQELLREVNGAEAELSRQLKVSRQTVNETLNNPNNTLKTKIRYTKAFNKCFETEYSYKELFN